MSKYEGGRGDKVSNKKYYITTKDDEYFKVLAVVRHALEQSRIEDGVPMWNVVLEKLYNNLDKEESSGITESQMNLIIQLLLRYVPDEIKESY